jgi:hypothetical protein
VHYSREQSAGYAGCATGGRQIFANPEAFAIRQTFAIWHEPAETRSSSPNSVAEASPVKAPAGFAC